MTTPANATNAWPSTTDDDGTGQTGTGVDAAFIAEMEACLSELVHSTSNPTETPSGIIDEVVAARGNAVDLDTRISGVIDDDGALITPATVVSLTQLDATLGASINFCKNSTFFLWSAGKTSAPDYWTLANGTITIAGTGEADTTRKVGNFCAAITWSSGTASITQEIVDSVDFAAAIDHYSDEQHYVAFSMWVKTSIASHARIVVDDGDTQTASSYHTGGNTFEWLTVNHQISAAATDVTIRCEVAAAGTAYFSGGVATFVDGADSTIPYWYPEPVRQGHVQGYVPGALATGDGQLYFSFGRPTFLKYLTAFVVNQEPTGDAIALELEKLTGAATWTAALASVDVIADNDGIGGKAIAASSTLRCLSGLFATSGAVDAAGNANKLARLNIDTVGSTNPGNALYVRIDAVQCVHPFEDLVSFDFMGT